MSEPAEAAAIGAPIAAVAHLPGTLPHGASQREEIYRRVISEAGAVPYILEYATNSYSFMGEGIEKLTGIPADEFRAESWNEIKVGHSFLGGQAGLSVEEATEIARRGGQIHWRCDIHIRHRDGTERWLFDASVEVIGADGTSIGSIGSLQDITERKRLEQESAELAARVEREQARHEMELRLLETQRLESIGVLAGGIAHAFNNILLTILGNASLAKNSVPDDQRAGAYIEQVEEAATKAAQLTKQMLVFAGGARFEVEPIDVGQLTMDIAVLVGSARPKLDLICDCVPGLPPVQADSGQMRQVVLDLLTNACEAIGDRTGTINVRTRYIQADRQLLDGHELGSKLQTGPFIQLEIEDDGPGMQPDQLARIFDPFYTTKFTGRGLGLSAVLGIVRSHLGAIKVESERGRGTIFSLLFPTI